MQGISHKDQNQLEKSNVICNFCNKDTHRYNLSSVGF